MKDKKDDLTSFDTDIVDVDEVAGTDVKINPDFYIHTGLLKAQHALTKENVKDGFVQYRILIEHIEVLCKAANMLNETYEKEVKDYSNSEELKKINDDAIKSAKIANKKLGLMMQEVFKNKISTAPLSLDGE